MIGSFFLSLSLLFLSPPSFPNSRLCNSFVQSLINSAFHSLLFTASTAYHSKFESKSLFCSQQGTWRNNLLLLLVFHLFCERRGKNRENIALKCVGERGEENRVKERERETDQMLLSSPGRSEMGGVLPYSPAFAQPLTSNGRMGRSSLIGSISITALNNSPVFKSSFRFLRKEVPSFPHQTLTLSLNFTSSCQYSFREFSLFLSLSLQVYHSFTHSLSSLSLSPFLVNSPSQSTLNRYQGTGHHLYQKTIKVSVVN